MKRYIAVIELDDDEEIVGDANISYTYRSNGTNYGTDESVELKEESEGVKVKTYEDGLNDAWGVARKIGSTDGYTCGELEKIFGLRSVGYIVGYILDSFTASEAIDAIENYEGIKVGDEVIGDIGGRGVVIRVSPDHEHLTVMLDDGTAMRWIKEEFKKTGRHFPQIAEVLQKMQEGDE